MKPGGNQEEHRQPEDSLQSITTGHGGANISATGEKAARAMPVNNWHVQWAEARHHISARSTAEKLGVSAFVHRNRCDECPSHLVV